MPRKKSAAKKAVADDLFAQNSIQDELFGNGDDEKPTEFTINQEYARRFEHNKKREDLHRLQEKYKDSRLDSDDDSTSEEEDDIGDLNTPQIDAAILNIISRIRKKDKALYESEVKFFEDAERDALGETVKVKQVKPTRIADVHRETLLSGKANVDYDVQDSADTVPNAGMTHVQEQNALRNAFKDVGEDADSDDDVLIPRKKSAQEQQDEEAEYETFLKQQLDNGVSEQLLSQLKSGNDTNPEGEEFLLNYVLKRGWIDKDADRVPSYDQLVDSEDEFNDWEEKAEKFETNYNFRFEQPGATEITTHPRDVQSVRRKEEKRKKEREARNEKEESIKRERREEINRLRNLKKAEIERKIKQIEEVTGRPMNFDEIDLEADFDPDEWDTKMIERFDDGYYGEKEEKPSWEDDIEIADLGIPESDHEGEYDVEPELAQPSHGSQGLTKREEKQRKRKVDAMVDATIPEPLGPGGRMFRYRKVDPDAFGLSVEDILFADDRQLNDYVGLKKLASFKPHEKHEKDRKKYGSKKRIKQFQKELWSQSRWSQGRDSASGSNAVELDDGTIAKKKQKKGQRGLRTTEA